MSFCSRAQSHHVFNSLPQENISSHHFIFAKNRILFSSSTSAGEFVALESLSPSRKSLFFTDPSFYTALPTFTEHFHPLARVSLCISSFLRFSPIKSSFPPIKRLSTVCFPLYTVHIAFEPFNRSESSFPPFLGFFFDLFRFIQPILILSVILGFLEFFEYLMHSAAQFSLEDASQESHRTFGHLLGAILPSSGHHSSGCVHATRAK